MIMDETKVSFSSDLLNRLEEIVFFFFFFKII